MSSAPPIESFRGRGTWDECNDFIKALRAATWKEGKIWDDTWMAGLAPLHFSHKARLWHSQLPADVRRDWSQLETSIITRWAPSEDDDGAKIDPTPAAASSPKRGAHASIQGVLRIIVEGSNRKYYIKFVDSNSHCMVTSDVNEAFRVHCNSTSGSTLLEIVNHPSHSWLAVHWNSSTPKIGDGSTDYAILSFVDSYTLTSSWGPLNPWQLLKCTVSEDGEVSLVWRLDQTSERTLFPFIYDDEEPYLVTDPESYSRKYPREQRGKLTIEYVE